MPRLVSRSCSEMVVFRAFFASKHVLYAWQNTLPGDEFGTENVSNDSWDAANDLHVLSVQLRWLQTVGVISDGRHVCDFGFGNASGYYDIIDRPIYQDEGVPRNSSQGTYDSNNREDQKETEKGRDNGDDKGAHSDTGCCTTPTKTSWASSSRSNSDVMKGQQYSTQMFQDRAIEVSKTPYLLA